MNVIILNFKKCIFTFICLIFIILLLVFSNTNIIAASNGLKLWATSVVPCLFPFFIATELLYYTNLVYILNKFFAPIMKKTFNLPGCAIFPFTLGTISGYPTGAKIVSELRKNKNISKSDAEHLLAFSNNSGPLFILGTVGISIFCNQKIGILLLITHILGSILTGIILKYFKKNSINFPTLTYTTPKQQNFGTIIINSISKAISSILNIGGFIVIFSVLISIFDNLHLFTLISNILKPIGLSKTCITGLLKGSLELTSGLTELSIISEQNLLIIMGIASFILGFGGISVILQVSSIISNTDISIKKYIFGKFLHGLISCFLTILIIWYFNINL